MVKRYVAPIAATLFFFNFNVPEKQTTFLSYDFTQQEVSLANQAADEWCNKTSHCVKFVYLGKSSATLTPRLDELTSSMFVMVNDLDAFDKVIGIDGSVTGDRAAACYRYNEHSPKHPSVIAVRDKRSNDWTKGGHCSDFYKTVLHELGHAFGRSHDPVAGNVMFGGILGMSCSLTWRDVGFSDEE